MAWSLPHISALPPEILHHILTYLPISTLLGFGQTSRRHYLAAGLAVQNLQLAILPRRIHGVLAFLNSSTFEETDAIYGDLDYDSPAHNQIVVPSPLPVPLIGTKRRKSSGPPPVTPAQHRERLFELQNALACSVLSTPSLGHLRSLTLHIYDIVSPSLTEILATGFPSLRHLHLNFSHRYLHDSCLPAHYWTSSHYLQASPIWDALAGIGEEHESNLKLRNLENLTVERAGLTSVQLQKWVEKNPRLRHLTLRNVAGVDVGFVQFLGGAARDWTANGGVSRSARLETLALEHCASLTLTNVEDFVWLNSLFDIDADKDSIAQLRGSDRGHRDPTSALETMSLHGSKSVSTASMVTYLETSRPALRQVTLPDGKVLAVRPKTTASGSSSPYINIREQIEAPEWDAEVKDQRTTEDRNDRMHPDELGGSSSKQK
ncbi:hypothetical protein A1O1_08800 [Capronia coronata CBS 617.96]|uniref:F-box domain-containing protein n=1 Tax=Capronia coronata CBS 617.96 TaxID=1182541 RepID=W9XM64_9EURO|nr:uncharacterized protein A1O1_08800 [Capronia coronata CBS 617.96]EXJ78400.1 hypothetical protein A1O1_08800 [Capronia coronata CBS 617.96]